MSVEVPCPNCGAILRAPAGAAGKKARCKKCQHGFRLPGAKEDANDSVGDESQQLSVVDQPAFAFVAPPDLPGDEPAAVPREAKGSRSKYKSSMSKSSAKKSTRGGDRNKPAKSRAALVLILFGVVALLGAGGFALYVMNQSKKPEHAAASVAPPKETPVPEKDADKPKEKDSAKKKDADKNDRKAAGAAVPGAAKGPKPKAVVMTGGLKLPAPPAKAENLKKPAVTVKVDTPYKEIRKVFITGGDSPLAVIVWKSAEGFQGAGAKDTVDRYNLLSGDRIDRTDVAVENAGWPRACDVSPSGELFLNEGPAGTLTLYDLNAKVKIGTLFKPFTGEEKAPAASIAAAFFIDNSDVIVAAKDGRLETWKAKEGTKISSGGLGAIALTAKSVAMKSDRSKLIAAAGGAIREVSVKTLTEGGSTPLPGGGDGLALSMDGSDRVAAIYRATQPGLHNRLVVVRLGDPKPAVDTALDESLGTPDALEWCGPEAFTFTTENKSAAVVFETEVNKPLATLWPQGGVAKHAFSNGKHFVLMPEGDGKKCLLLGLDFPPDDFLPLRNEAVEAKAPIGFLLTPEGFGR